MQIRLLQVCPRTRESALLTLSGDALAAGWGPHEVLEQKWANHASRAKSSLQLVCVNKVVLQHSHAHSCLLSTAAFMLSGRSEVVASETVQPTKPNCFNSYYVTLYRKSWPMPTLGY